MVIITTRPRRATFTSENNQSTIVRVLTWLKDSKEVEVEKPGPDRGYPPGLSITTSGGNVTIDWTSNQLDYKEVG